MHKHAVFVGRFKLGAKHSVLIGYGVKYMINNELVTLSNRCVYSKQCLARHRIYPLANTMQMIPTRGVQIGELLRSTISSTPSHVKYHLCN
jgi:hypothetical protein